MSEHSGFDASIARIAVGAYEDAQEERKAMMNRVRDLVRKRNEGIPMDAVEEEDEDPSFDSKYNDDNLADLITEMRGRSPGEGGLTDREFEYLNKMLEAGQAAARVENRYQDIMRIAEGEPIYTEWLDNVYGVSHTLTAKLLHRFGYCEDFARVSNLWSYAGLAPGQGPTPGEKLGYDPQAKTLAWLVATNMVRQGDDSRYRAEFYDPYKEEQVRRMNGSMCTYCGEPTHEHIAVKGKRTRYCTEEKQQEVSLDDFLLPDGCPEEATPPWQQAHADTRAKRYLAKKFLKHYWAIARDIRGLDTPDEWVITHGGHEKREDTFENPFHARRVLSPA